MKHFGELSIKRLTFGLTITAPSRFFGVTLEVCGLNWKEGNYLSMDVGIFLFNITLEVCGLNWMVWREPEWIGEQPVHRLAEQHHDLTFDGLIERDIERATQAERSRRG